ncbi:unnamed protein product [Dibothriocephalus latus]|uniref:Uncharacterized protein n=1 Tax=Dibothriocephalus latus TaxID=60516 RepID=A0A3P7P1B6_DIBLA|nr:unnamed protein product [Dibothriocephalus latus]
MEAGVFEGIAGCWLPTPEAAVEQEEEEEERSSIMRSCRGGPPSLSSGIRIKGSSMGSPFASFPQQSRLARHPSNKGCNLPQTFTIT